MTKQLAYGLLVIIVCVGTGIRIKLANDKVLHHWDEKFHALVAKHCMDEPFRPVLYKTTLLDYDYKNWYNNHVWLHKQPLPLWLMAASMKLFGVNEFAVRVPSLLFSALLMVLVFVFTRRWYSHLAALLASFFLAVNGLFIELGAGRVATDHYDVLFAAFIFLGIYFAQLHAFNQKIWFAVLSGFFIGLALLSKWLPALIVIPVHGLFLLHAGKKTPELIVPLALSLLTAVAIALPWQLYILSRFPVEAKWEYLHNWLHITSELEGHNNPGVLYYLHKIRVNYSEIIYLPLALLLLRLFKHNKRLYLDVALVVWIFIPILFFSLAQTKMQGYILFVAPALFIITAEFFEVLQTTLRTQTKGIYRLGGYLVMAAILVLPLRYCYERSQFGFGPVEEDSRRSVYKQLNGKYPEKTVLLNCKWPIECMFYTPYIAYPNSEISQQAQQTIISKGFNILYLNDAGTLVAPR